MSRSQRVACLSSILAAAVLLGVLLTQGFSGRDSERVRSGSQRPTIASGLDDSGSESEGRGVSLSDPKGDESDARTGGFSLAGKCLQGGETVAGATVLLYSLHREGQTYFETPVDTSSDKDGRYAFDDMAPGFYLVTARKGLERSRRTRLKLDRDLNVELQIGPGQAELRVRFVGLDAVVQGAPKLELYNLIDPGPALRPDDRGTCLLRDLHLGELCKFKVVPPKGYFLRSQHKPGGGKLGEAAYFDVRIESGQQEIAIQVGRFARVRGKVLSPEGTTGDVTIEARTASRFAPRVTVSASTRGSQYEMQVLPGQAFALFVVTTTARTKTGAFGLRKPIVLLGLKPGEVREVDLSLTPLPGRIHGSLVTHDGSPVSGAGVHASIRIPSSLPGVRPFQATSFGRSDATGAFMLDGIPSGVLHLGAGIKDRPDVADPATVVIPGVGGGVINIGSIVAPRAATLRGKISGTRRAGTKFLVHATPRFLDGSPDYARWRTVWSDERGVFVFQRMTPGDHLLYVGGMDYTPVVVRIAETRETEVTVPPPS